MLSMSLAPIKAGAGFNGSIWNGDNNIECASCGLSHGSQEMARYPESTI
jgi:hypothetical protein